MKMKSLQDQITNGVPLNRLTRAPFMRRSANFGECGPTSNCGDNWHRNLTGRQAPEPVSQKLKMIYGRVISEKLPQDMLDLLSQLETKSSEN
jgi:hypothetical protein